MAGRFRSIVAFDVKNGGMKNSNKKEDEDKGSKQKTGKTSRISKRDNEKWDKYEIVVELAEATLNG